MGEQHVFADIMQLIDWIRTAKASAAWAEYTWHVVEIIDASYRSERTGEKQPLQTSFDELPRT